MGVGFRIQVLGLGFLVLGSRVMIQGSGPSGLAYCVISRDTTRMRS